MAFDDVARQWIALFDEADYHVVTVFLAGEEREKVRSLAASFFWGIAQKIFAD